MIRNEPVNIFTQAGFSASTDADVSEIETDLLTAAELRARRLPSRIIQLIFAARVLPLPKQPKISSKEPCFEDILIVQSLLEKNFTKMEIVSLFELNPEGAGYNWSKARRKDKYMENLFSRVREELEQTPAGKKWAEELNASRRLPPDYTTDEAGAVWHQLPAAAGRNLKSVKVSNSPVWITGIHEHLDNGQISVVIAYDYLGSVRSVVITRVQMCDARQLVAALAGRGAPINSNNARLLINYLAAYEQAFGNIIPRTKVTSRFGRGRTGKTFFLPGAAANVQFSPPTGGDASVFNSYAGRAGGLYEWIEMINHLAHENYIIPQIALMTTFIPPLQRYLGIPNFVLDIYGATSSGKSTTLKLAASVFGSPFDPDSLIYQWMNTKLAVEQLAAVCSELPIFLDDAQHCPDELKRSIVYMIANGRGKARASIRGMRETLSWHTVALSTSEEPLFEASAYEGIRSRLLSVGGLTPPFPPGSATFVQSLERAVSFNYGHAGETFIRHLNRWTARDWAHWTRRYALLRSELIYGASSDIVGRVSGYIAAIGVAAEIACPILELEFKPTALVAWLSSHIRDQQISQDMTHHIVRVLADYYLSNQDSFAGTTVFAASNKSLQGVSRKDEYVGFTRSALDQIFAKYKWRQTTILNKLAAAGALHATEADRHTKKVTFAGVNHRLVCVRWSALLPDNLPGEAGAFTRK